MTRFFNTTGPCDPADHYMLPAEERLPDLQQFIDRKLYFTLQAPRQTGKTTAMRAFADRLRRQGHVAVHMSMAEAQVAPEVIDSEPIWIAALARAAREALPTELHPPSLASLGDAPIGTRFALVLERWCVAAAPAWVVLLIDEVNTRSGPAMISLLRQLRESFPMRPERFPSSVALIGMRDLRDYVTEAKGGAPVNPGSPFNIKKTSLTLRDFTRAEIGALYAQHTAETGQPFTDAALDQVATCTGGQPFLVNALADLMVETLVADRSVPVDVAHVGAARERLILSRTTHLDALAWRLREARVVPIVRSILLGEDDEELDTASDDIVYAVDLGLVRRAPDGPEIANPIYREVLVRVLTRNRQERLPRPWWRWATEDGRLDFPALVEAFLAWWRENADDIRRVDPSPYPEALPQLCFMAFLQRVVNGGGQVSREYAAGRGRIDILVCYGAERFVVELKRVWRRDPERVRREGVHQLASCLDRVGVDEGWLLIFDERGTASWEERMWAEEVVVGGRTIRLRGG